MRVSRHRDGSSTCLQAPCRAWVSVYPISSAYCPQNQYYCSRKRLKLQYLLREFSRKSENSSFNPILRGIFVVFIKKHGISTESEGIYSDFRWFERLKSRYLRRFSTGGHRGKEIDQWLSLTKGLDKILRP